MDTLWCPGGLLLARTGLAGPRIADFGSAVGGERRAVSVDGCLSHSHPRDAHRGCPVKRAPQPRNVRRVPRADPDESTVLIESLTVEALDRIVALLARNGVEQGAIEGAFRRACDKHSRRRRSVSSDSLAAQYEAVLLLAAWYTDLEYLDPEGRPLRLPLTGAAPSLHALIKRVGLKRSARDIVRYLERVKAIRFVEQEYEPLRRAKALLGAGRLANRETLRMVVRLLRSIDERCAQRRAASLDEINVVTALESTEIPVRLRSVCRAQVTRDIQQFLRELESRMLRYERARVRGEPLMRMGIGVFHFEEAPPEGPCRVRTRAKTRSAERTAVDRRSR